MHNSTSVSHAPAGRTFLKYLLPSLIGLLAISSASIVDGIFIGRYEGETALAAINLLIPIFSMFAGLFYMLAVGGSVSAGKWIGEQNLDDSSAIFSKTLIALALISILFAGSSFLLADALYGLLGAQDSLKQLLNDYFKTLLPFLPIQALSVGLYFFVRIAGKPALASAALIAAAVLNIALDYLFIAKLDLGLYGAALATGLSQLSALLVLLLYFFQKDKILRFGIRQKNWGSLAASAFNGLSEFINEMSAGTVAFIINLLIIKQLGTQGLAAFSLVNYTMFIGLLVSFSIADCLQALSSQCYGAKQWDQLRRFLFIALASSISVGIAFSILLLSSADSIMAVFIKGQNPELLEQAMLFASILWPVFILNGLNITLSAYLTALHKAAASSLIALSRSLILPLLFIALFINFLPEYSPVLSITLAEGFTLIVAILLYWKFSISRMQQESRT
ncbi:MATE family efflux transporter [uncultured Pseudoteredinibacter sp.]|uniref:MATE family efflux transporter n=1 Tax=uncultured Pseudoteredinibacter sp. TaxID=1641701 RepID=UPI00260C0BBA|nr:MATE family efflux transporter [uncultured Pseudoteredinibacter sp.]